MKLPTEQQWEQIHALADVLEALPLGERRERLEALRDSEDPLVHSCLRAHLLVTQPEADVELAAGTLVAGKYEIRESIGMGGMGIVYRATQQRTGRDIALKAIRPRMVSAALRARFEREIASLARLRHLALVRLFDADVFTDAAGAEQLFYTMDLVDGPGLDVWIRDSGASLERRLRLLEKICRGVQAAHEQGIVHCDLKPQNILVEKGDQPVILDFGLARLRGELLAGDGEATDGAAALVPIVSLLSGTPAYMDPGQSSLGSAGEAADIYALGVIAFETIAGQLPFDLPENPTLRQIREAVAHGDRHELRDFVPAVPASLDAVVQQALRRRAADRYPDVGHFADALLDQATRSQRLRRRTALSVAFGSLALVSLTAAGFALNARHESEQRRAQAVRAEQASDGLVDFLLNDLRNRLEPTGRLDLMEPVVEKAVAHYEERRIEHRDSSSSLLALAAALQTKGNVLGVRGKTAEAESAFRLAIAHTVTARERDPANPRPHLALAGAYAEIGDHLMRCEQYPKALLAYQEGAAAIAVALELDPGSSVARHREAASQRHIGDAYAYHLDQLDKAMAAYTASRDLYDALLLDEPDAADIRAERALLETSIGSLDETLGDFPGMLRHFGAYHDYVLQTDGAGTVLFAHSAFRMGVALEKTGDFAGAVRYLEPATEIAETNVARHPGETESLKLLASCLRFLADAYEGRGEQPEAERARQRLFAVRAAFDQILAGEARRGALGLEAEMGRLHEAGGDDEDWSRFVYRVRLSVEAEHAGDLDEQIAGYQRWLAQTEALRSGAGGWDAQLALADASFHNRIGDARLAGGRPLEAAASYDLAYALRHARWEMNPDSARTQLDLISSAGHRLNARIEAGQLVESLAAAREFVDAAASLSAAALNSNGQGLAYAKRFADLADAARAQWPEASASLDALAAEAAEQLLDRLPAGGEGAVALRGRLVARP